MSEITVYEHILRKLDALLERIDEMDSKVERIEERLDDAEYARYIGGARY